MYRKKTTSLCNEIQDVVFELLSDFVGEKGEHAKNIRIEIEVTERLGDNGELEIKLVHPNPGELLSDKQLLATLLASPTSNLIIMAQSVFSEPNLIYTVAVCSTEIDLDETGELYYVSLKLDSDLD